MRAGDGLRQGDGGLGPGPATAGQASVTDLTVRASLCCGAQSNCCSAATNVVAIGRGEAHGGVTGNATGIPPHRASNTETATMTDLNSMTKEQLIAALLASQKATERKLTLKVSEKGAVSLYGMGRFPVTLYGEQWSKLLDHADTIRAFLTTNASLLSSKADKA